MKNKRGKAMTNNNGIYNLQIANTFATSLYLIGAMLYGCGLAFNYIQPQTVGNPLIGFYIAIFAGFAFWCISLVYLTIEDIHISKDWIEGKDNS